MSELIDTTQMYLRTVYELIEAGIEPRRARIVERLHQAGPTVSQTVARMERDGLLTLRDGRTIELTDEGFIESRNVMRRHRLSECLIMNNIGLDFSGAHEEACRWEHVISEHVTEKMADMLGGPERTPYGTPIPDPDAEDIPPLDLLGADLATALDSGLGQAEFVLADEHAQCDPELLAALDAAGVRPGTTVGLARAGDDYLLTTDSGFSVRVPEGCGGSLRVRELAGTE